MHPVPLSILDKNTKNRKEVTPTELSQHPSTTKGHGYVTRNGEGESLDIELNDRESVMVLLIQIFIGKDWK